MSRIVTPQSAFPTPADDRPGEHRLALTVAVAAATVAVVAVLAFAGPALDELIGSLPSVNGPAAAGVFLAVVGVLALATIAVRFALLAHNRARRRALEARFEGGISCGLRHRELEDALAELPGCEVPLATRYSIVADRAGLTFWNGGARPRRAAHVAWREVRSIRPDELIAGSRPAPVVIVRVRRQGTSIALPLLLAGEQPGVFAVTDAPFYAVVRSWKALHRTALEHEGLEPPTSTTPIPVITASTAARPDSASSRRAARRDTRRGARR
ncbi:hypothetical protein [Agromyces mediolanus]|uniref:hypothetical protein n=1 Tax=Agromyces mediolanus TaxID=41986 RepID=UPI001E527227|nr:hypothetical protein [Agromyces mediolanus]MCD1573228.1 hypothetical protein [Agromyces mediolanus]